MTEPQVILVTFSNDNSEVSRYLNGLSEEIQSIRKSLEPLDVQGKVKLIENGNVSLERVYDLLNNYKDRITIFHYAGHADNQHLDFDDFKVKTENLVNLLTTQEKLQLVFLNACRTGNWVNEYLNPRIKALIATKFEVSDKKATIFAKRFYQALAKDYSIQESYDQACEALKAEGVEAPKKNKVIVQSFQRGIGSQSQDTFESTPWVLYINENYKRISDWKLSKPTTEDFINYLQKLNKWIELKRKTSLDYLPITVQMSTESRLESIESLRILDIMEILASWKKEDEIPVIIGESGSGKTFSIWEAVIKLSKRLIENSHKNTNAFEDYPIPVYIDLAYSKNQKIYSKNSIQQIILDQINDISTFGAGNDQVSSGIKKKPAYFKYIIFFDGIEEISDTNGKLNEAFDAFWEFKNTYRNYKLVFSSRTIIKKKVEWKNFKKNLHLTEYQIRAISLDQIETFFNKPNFQEKYDRHIKDRLLDADFSQLIQQPLFLNAIVEIVDEIPSNLNKSTLLETYFEKRFGPRAKRPYKEEILTEQEIISLQEFCYKLNSERNSTVFTETIVENFFPNNYRFYKDESIEVNLSGLLDKLIKVKFLNPKKDVKKSEIEYSFNHLSYMHLFSGQFIYNKEIKPFLKIYEDSNVKSSREFLELERAIKKKAIDEKWWHSLEYAFGWIKPEGNDCKEVAKSIFKIIYEANIELAGKCLSNNRNLKLDEELKNEVVRELKRERLDLIELLTFIIIALLIILELFDLGLISAIDEYLRKFLTNSLMLNLLIFLPIIYLIRYFYHKAIINGQIYPLLNFVSHFQSQVRQKTFDEMIKAKHKWLPEIRKIDFLLKTYRVHSNWTKKQYKEQLDSSKKKETILNFLPNYPYLDVVKKIKADISTYSNKDCQVALEGLITFSIDLLSVNNEFLDSLKKIIANDRKYTYKTRIIAYSLSRELGLKCGRPRRISKWDFHRLMSRLIRWFFKSDLAIFILEVLAILLFIFLIKRAIFPLFEYLQKVLFS